MEVKQIMRSFKKIISSVLGTAMALSMCVAPTFAAADPNSNSNRNNAEYTITIDNAKEGHTYEAYQIFEGDISGDDGAYVLSNIDYGEGIDASKLTGQFAGKTAKELAKMLSADAENEDYTELANIFAQHISADRTNILTTPSGTCDYSETEGYKIKNLKPGYYLIKDRSAQLEGKYDANTAFMLKVVGDATVTPKSDIPSVQKKVLDANDSVNNSTTPYTQAGLGDAWADSADYDAYCDDAVPFKITATLPTDNTTNGQGFSQYSKYRLVFHDTFEPGLSAPLNNIKDYRIFIGTHELTEEEKVTVGASVATTDNGFDLTIENVKALTGDNAAVAGGTVSVIYKLTLDHDTAVIGSVGQANTIYLTYSNNPNAGYDQMGETPRDTVRVFTYKIDVDKVDPDLALLAGAEFKLEKYNPSNSSEWDVVIEKMQARVNAENGDAQFEVKGIDDGIYRITETATPAGYNTIKPITFTVNASHDAEADDPKLIELTVTDVSMDALLGDTTSDVPEFTAAADDGMVATKIVNEKGLVLPKTGDVGTALLYAIGAMAIVAGAYHFTRKKQGNEN